MPFFLRDLHTLVDKKCCAFIRPYIPGEFDGFKIREDLNLNEITHVFVIEGSDEDHVVEHLLPIGETYKAAFFDSEEGMPMLARVPLLPEQVIVLKQNGEQE